MSIYYTYKFYTYQNLLITWTLDYENLHFRKENTEVYTSYITKLMCSLNLNQYGVIWFHGAVSYSFLYTLSFLILTIT